VRSLSHFVSFAQGPRLTRSLFRTTQDNKWSIDDDDLDGGG